jgi:hypothetical protein
VRREDRGRAHELARFVEREPVVADQLARAREHEERRVAFVDVEHARLDAQRAEQLDAAAAEHELLAQAMLVVATVRTAA